MFKFISDGPGFSYTRVCADDFGSALAQLQRLKAQASIFAMAEKVAGLCLKPSKCVLIISCMELSEELVFAIRNWLVVNIPAFKDFKIQSSGKYLGLSLGGSLLLYHGKTLCIRLYNESTRWWGGKPLLLARFRDIIKELSPFSRGKTTEAV